MELQRQYQRIQIAGQPHTEPGHLNIENSKHVWMNGHFNIYELIAHNHTNFRNDLPAKARRAMNRELNIFGRFYDFIVRSIPLYTFLNSYCVTDRPIYD